MSWETIPFGSLIDFNPSVNLQKGEVYSFLPMDAVSPERKYAYPNEQRPYTGGGAKFEEQDVLFARITPCLENGKITRVRDLTNGRGFGSTEYFVLRAKLGISDPDFVYYLARSKSVRGPAIKSMAGASGRQRASADAVKKALVNAPSLEVQAKIGVILSRYDSVIDCNQQRIEATEELVSRIFHEWFVHRRFPGHKKTQNWDPIPDGWRECKLPEIAEINPRTAALKSVEKIYVPMSGLSETLSVISKTERRTKTSGTKFINFDTLLARITPCIENGKTALVQILDEGEVGIGSTEFIVLRPKPEIGPYWLYCFARTHELRQTAINSMKGSDGRQRVNPDCFLNFKVLVPCTDLLERFSEIASPAFSMINLLMQQNEHLSNARDAMTNRLMAGCGAI